MNDKQQIRMQKRAEYIKEKRKQKYTCVCGKVIGIYGKTIHEKSDFHRDFFAEKEEIMLGGHKVIRIIRRTDDIERYYKNKM